MQRVENRLIWGVGVFVWIVFCLHVVPGGGINPNRYYDLTESLVNYHSLNIDAYHTNTLDKAFFQGHYYSSALPGPSVLAIPAYLVYKVIYAVIPKAWLVPLQDIKSFEAGQTTGFYAEQDTVEFFLSTAWLTVWVLSILSALATVYVIRLLRLLSFSLIFSILGGLTYAFGTLVFFFSTIYFAHGFHAAFVVFALYHCVRLTVSDGGTPRDYILVGFLAGMTFAMEFLGAVFVVLFALYSWRLKKWQGLGYFVLGSLVPCGVVLIYNTSVFGVPWGVPYQYLVERSFKVHESGILGLTLPTPERLIGLTFSLDRGIFIYCPIFLLALPGWIIAWKKEVKYRWLIILLLALVETNFAYNLFYNDWKGGASFGPRFLVPTMVCWVVGVVYAYRALRYWIWSPLLILSVFINWLGAQFGFGDTFADVWQNFTTTGPILPSLSAVITHGSEGGSLRAMVVYAYPYLMIVYGVFIALLLAVLLWQLRRFQRRYTDDNVVLT